MSLYSSPEQLEQIQKILRNFLRLPFGYTSIPGNLLEGVLAEIRGEDTLRLGTYDFVDVVSPEEHLGWQVKSTHKQTPVTWKRVKLPHKESLIEESHTSAAGCAALGQAILDFCNHHVAESMHRYQLQAIGYARLIQDKGQFIYFEKPLVTPENPILFPPEQYTWHWSETRARGRKEMLPAFNGMHTPTNVKHFAWHGKGENQLHFTGERVWWPAANSPNRREFTAPDKAETIRYVELAEWLLQMDAGSGR